MTEGERREVAGLHPDRAPTIVAGVALLLEALRGLRPRRGRGLRARHPARRRASARGGGGPAARSPSRPGRWRTNPKRSYSASAGALVAARPHDASRARPRRVGSPAGRVSIADLRAGRRLAALANSRAIVPSTAPSSSQPEPARLSAPSCIAQPDRLAARRELARPSGAAAARPRTVHDLGLDPRTPRAAPASFASTCGPVASSSLRQVRLARVDDVGVGEHVDERRLARPRTRARARAAAPPGVRTSSPWPPSASTTSS